MSTVELVQWFLLLSLFGNVIALWIHKKDKS